MRSRYKMAALSRTDIQLRLEEASEKLLVRLQLYFTVYRQNYVNSIFYLSPDLRP